MLEVDDIKSVILNVWFEDILEWLNGQNLFWQNMIWALSS